MVDIDKSVVCRLKKGSDYFEILVDPDKALVFKKGKETNLEDILAVPGVYKDVRKGESISNDELQKNFGTRNFNEIAKKILNEGDLQFTTDQRRQFIEDKT
ncbi:MAG: ribosome assembly factor SBDS, partial [Candidatus Aenigmarchaeota archaeon]|nr:ribosome assembly factor SBDS [Candidatus Aenigmarchaeota archaeon]